MNASSSFEAALIGGPCSFAFSLPPIANAIKPKVVPRVAIESCSSSSGCQSMLATLVEDEGKREASGRKDGRNVQHGSRLDDQRLCIGRP